MWWEKDECLRFRWEDDSEGECRLVVLETVEGMLELQLALENVWMGCSSNVRARTIRRFDWPMRTEVNGLDCLFLNSLSRS